MSSITLKRSAATLGVVAGLLAAAGPASAQLPASASGVKAPTTAKPLILAGTADDSMRLTGSKTPRANTGEVAMESVTQLNDVEAIDFNALGTQVGSEGVKRNGRGFFDIPAELNRFGSDDTLRANGFGLSFEHIDFVKAPTAGVS